MQNNAVFHKHQPNKRNEDNPPPLKTEKGEIGDITLLTTFNVNEDVLYQDYTSKFPEEGGNENIGQWYGRAKDHGDRMCIWILT